MRPVPLAGDHALVEIEQEHIAGAGLVGREPGAGGCQIACAHDLGVKRGDAVGREPDRLDGGAGEAFEPVEPHPVAAFGRESGSVL